MARVRVSTTVDEKLLTSAREALSDLKDAALIDQALQALLDGHRSAEIDTSYQVYDHQPLSDPDDWGDLESFREAAGRS